MKKVVQTTEEQVKEFCARIGMDPLLVQGAGGNVSWKDGSIIWVKASGTWLVDSRERDIFVPVDLDHLRQSIIGRDFSVTPKVVGESNLRPSIETLLHALMPQGVVVHLHAIEVLAHLVRQNFEAGFKGLQNKIKSWAVIDYIKPGAALAEEINSALLKNPFPRVIFLKNHGIVIGGEDVAEVVEIIGILTQELITIPAYMVINRKMRPVRRSKIPSMYSMVADVELHQLALNPNLFKRLSSDWALYPDHVVFLGPRAYFYLTWDDFNDEQAFEQDLPELVFIFGDGVYVSPSFGKSKQVQLRCYFDVIVRQKQNIRLRSLDTKQIHELIDWSAESYRVGLSR